MRLGHLAEMEKLRVRLITINSNADTHTLSSPPPTYSGEDSTLAKTLASVYGPK